MVKIQNSICVNFYFPVSINRFKITAVFQFWGMSWEDIEKAKFESLEFVEFVDYPELFLCENGKINYSKFEEFTKAYEIVNGRSFRDDVLALAELQLESKDIVEGLKSLQPQKWHLVL